MTKSLRLCIEVIFWPEISYGVSLRPMSLRHEIFKTTADGFLKGLSSTTPNTLKNQHTWRLTLLAKYYEVSTFT